MKSRLSLFLLSSLLISSSAIAGDEFQILPNYDTYWGVNFKESWLKTRGDWQRFLIKKQPGFDAFMGWRFMPNLAIEFGYEWTANKPYQTFVANGETILGVVNTSGAGTAITGKLRLKTAHTDLNLFIPFSLGGTINHEMIVSIGLTSTKPSFKIKADPENGFTNSFTSMEGKSHTIVRAGVGLQTMLVENLGARILVRYEKLSILRARNSVPAMTPGTQKIFRDSPSIAIGLFMKFQ